MKSPHDQDTWDILNIKIVAVHDAEAQERFAMVLVIVDGMLLGELIALKVPEMDAQPPAIILAAPSRHVQLRQAGT